MFEDLIAKAAAGAIAAKATRGMGAIQIAFDKQKYAPGETVTGKARFSLSEPKKITGFQIMVEGTQSKEKYLNDRVKESKSEKLLSSSYFATTDVIPSPKDGKGIIELPPGSYEVPFQLQLPAKADEPPAPVEKKGMFGKSVEKCVYRPPVFKVMGLLLSVGSFSPLQGEGRVPVEWPYCEAKKAEWDSTSSVKGEQWDSGGKSEWDQDTTSKEGGWDQDKPAPDSMGGAPSAGDPKGGWD